MKLTVADLLRQKEEVRARLLADEQIRERIPFRAFEISSRALDLAVLSKIACRSKVRSCHHWPNKSFNCRVQGQTGRASRANR
jgi:hypothetical protein